MAHTHTPGGMSGSWREMTHSAHDITTITRAEPSRQAFLMLWALFSVAPILFGLDKFTQWMTNWDGYLAPWINDLVPGTAHQVMMAVGVIEIVAGLVVALVPRLGGYVVAAWLAGIIVNLVSQNEYWDIALRDLGLLVAALALARLAVVHHQESAR
jgi:hypothetical protein